MANIRRVPFEHPTIRISEYIFSWKDGRVRKVLPGEICSLGKSPNMISVVFKQEERRILSLLFPDGIGPAEIVEFDPECIELVGEILRRFTDKIMKDVEIQLTSYNLGRKFQSIGFVFTRETIVTYAKHKKMAARTAPETLVRENSTLPFPVRMLRARRLS